MDYLTIWKPKQNVVIYKNLSVKDLCGRCLSAFIDWRYCQSCLYFQISFVNYCPSTLLVGLTLPPFPVWMSILYTCIQCVRGWGGYEVLGLREINTCRKVPLQVNFFRLWHFALLLWDLSFVQVQILCHFNWRKLDYKLTLFGLFLLKITGKNWRNHSNISNFWKGPGAKIHMRKCTIVFIHTREIHSPLWIKTQVPLPVYQ